MKKFLVQARSTQVVETIIEAADEEAALEIAHDMGVDEKWVESNGSDGQFWNIETPVEV